MENVFLHDNVYIANGPVLSKSQDVLINSFLLKGYIAKSFKSKLLKGKRWIDTTTGIGYMFLRLIRVFGYKSCQYLRF